MEVTKPRIYAWHLEAWSAFSWKECKPCVSWVGSTQHGYKRCSAEPLAWAGVWGTHSPSCEHVLFVANHLCSSQCVNWYLLSNTADGSLLLCTDLHPSDPVPHREVTKENGATTQWFRSKQDRFKIPTLWFSTPSESPLWVNSVFAFIILCLLRKVT